MEFQKTERKKKNINKFEYTCMLYKLKVDIYLQIRFLVQFNLQITVL